MTEIDPFFVILADSLVQVVHNDNNHEGRFLVGNFKQNECNRLDKKDELVKREFETVKSIVDESIRLGLQWTVSVIDLNEKMEYVMEMNVIDS